MKIKILIISSLYLIAYIFSPNFAFGKAELKWAADAESSVPFVFQDPKNPGKLLGFEKDIIEAISAELDMTPVFVQNQWDGLVPGLSRGDYDVAINAIEITEDRKQEALFTDPYYITFEQLVVRSSSNTINSLEDLYGKKAGACKFSVAERILKEKSKITTLNYEGEVNAFEDLKNERIDAALVDAPIALYYISWRSDLKLVGQPIGELHYGIVLSKTNKELRDKINQVLQKLAQTGKLREILDRWKLWNYKMALLLNDVTENNTPASAYEDYINSQKKTTPLYEEVYKYISFAPLLAQGALMTLELTICAMLLAIFLGLIIAVIRVYAPGPISALAVLYIELIRGTPLLIQLYFIFYALPHISVKISPFLSAVIGLGLNYAAYEAENYRAGIFSVSKGQMEAALSLGMKRRQALRLVVLPQAFRLVIPPVTNDFISLLKDSSLVSVITLVELTKIYGQLTSTYYNFIPMGIIVAGIYLLLGMPFVKLSKYFEKRLSVEKFTGNH